MVKRTNGYRFHYTNRDDFDLVVLLLEKQGKLKHGEILKRFPKKSDYLFDEIKYLVDKMNEGIRNPLTNFSIVIGDGEVKYSVNITDNQSLKISDLFHPGRFEKYFLLTLEEV